MRLHSIFIEDYRVLKEFALSFASFQAEDQSESPSGHRYGLDLIVGVNGTGKSTLLRAIAEIFRHL